MEAGARVEVNDRKRTPGDFALWKGAKPGEPQWDSPWGAGRPGWHIECSAMSMKLLGQTLDIHGGGVDLHVPHHENELAQSELFTGQAFATYWMHNGLMKTGNDKMSKSKGNEIVVSELLKRHAAETLRFFLLATHYRRPIDFGEDRLQETQRSLDNFHRFFERYEHITGSRFFQIEAPSKNSQPFEPGGTNTEFMVEVDRHRAAFLDHMEDDFNTGGAIGVLFELLTTLNRFADAKQLEVTKNEVDALADFERGVAVLRELSQILGIFQQAPPAKSTGSDELVNALMQLLIDLRAESRKSKNF